LVDGCGIFNGLGTPTWGPGDCYLFSGFVESYTPKWPDVTNSEVEIAAVDALEALNLLNIIDVAYKNAVLASSPLAYFRFGEAKRNLAAAAFGQWPAFDLIGGFNGNYNGTAVDGLGAQSMNPADSDTAVDCGTRTGWVLLPSTDCPTGNGDFSIEFGVLLRSWPANGDSDDYLFQAPTSGG